MRSDKEFLSVAIDLSEKIANQGGFPVGAIIVKNDEILGQGVSDGKRQHDPTLHAETDAIRRVCRMLKTRNLKGVTLYSSMEPCLMCYSSAYWSCIDRIIFGAGKARLDPMHYEKDVSPGLTEGIIEGWGLEVLQDLEQEDRAIRIIRDWEKVTYA